MASQRLEDRSSFPSKGTNISRPRHSSQISLTRFQPSIQNAPAVHIRGCTFLDDKEERIWKEVLKYFEMLYKNILF
jgi:hypothetical protein